MTPRGQALARSAAAWWAALSEHGKLHPAEADQLAAAQMAHLRSAYPTTPLGALEPTEPVRDPRKEGR